MRQPLDRQLRSRLEKTVGEARDIAEKAARIALERLGVENPRPNAGLNNTEKELHKQLRAHGLQLGDTRDDGGKQDIDLLAEETAYQYWHRMLFARFLAENNLLMFFETSTPVPVSLADCEELAKDQRMDGMEFAAACASKMLPQIFRIDSPVFELKLASNYIQDLEKRLFDLSPAIFQASDSLGWIYQFWQAKRKKEINDTNKKIGARELSAVTQLFTEPYMVSFLLDNSLGAWWAVHVLTDDDFRNAQTEEELRQKTALPGLPLTYLRFVKNKAGSWIPAAGKFEDWPKKLREFKVLDPCCGSGHFLVAALQMLVPIRCAMENLSVKDAIEAVLKENLHGLELDMRCVEIAAFNLAFTAWTFPRAEGWRKLPELQVACSGLSVGVLKKDWIKISGKNKKLPYILGLLYDDCENASKLGSLLNVSMKVKEGIDWADVYESLKKEDTSAWHETSVAAQGIAKSMQLLDRKYHWIITNPPYLAWGKQEDFLKNYLEKNYSKSKNDIATAFLEWCFKFCMAGGIISIVLPQNWLFLKTYKHLREKLLKNETWLLIARLGEHGFTSEAAAGAFASLMIFSHERLSERKRDPLIRCIDVSDINSPNSKDMALISFEIKSVEQEKQLENPDARILLEEIKKLPLLRNYADGLVGLQTGDDPMFIIAFWEIDKQNKNMWEFLQNSPVFYNEFTGQSWLVRWESGKGLLLSLKTSRPTQGLKALGRSGIVIHRMRSIFPYYYGSERFHQNLAVLIPYKVKYLPAIWCYCSSPEYNEAVRKIDQTLKVTNATLVKVPFDLNHWQKVASEKYPHGLPQPYSDDPTQWIFHGHPTGSVIWNEQTKKTTRGKLRCDKIVLHIAIARLLGYRWPAELDVATELSLEQREWVNRCAELVQFADEDGIVSIPAMRREQSAENRLFALLGASYGEEWSADTLSQLLKSADCQDKSLEYWLRNEFFRQHCELFGQRPFIWHIWDGLKDGFSVLVNYHKLDSRLLDSLIYTYLGDWISRQEREKGKVDGATERLDAARSLQQKLLAIQTGEAPLDIFVRWKPLNEQPVGWNPDLNDGVRLNIRPFMLVGDVKVQGAGILRDKPKITWKNDRGADASSAPWYNLGPAKGLDEGTRINDHHLTLAEKQKMKEKEND